MGLRIDFSKNHSDFSLEFSQFQVWYNWESEHYKPLQFLMILRSSFLGKGRGGCSLLSISLWYFVNIQHCKIKSSNFLKVFCGHLKLLIFVSIMLSSSSVSCSSLMSSWLSIIFVIDLSVTLEENPSRFLKCSFHFCIRSSWLTACSFGIKVLFFLLISFTVCQVIRDCLSSTEFLISLIWPWMYFF